MRTNALDDFFGRQTNVFHERVGWFLKCRELARDEIFASEMILARGQIAVKLVSGAAEQNNFKTQARAQRVAIDLLQSRARENNILVLESSPQQFIVNSVKPGPAIRLAQRNSPMHLFPISVRVKIVGIEKDPAQAPRQKFSHRRLSSASDTHYKDDHTT